MDMIWSEDYTGRRWTYASTLRPWRDVMNAEVKAKMLYGPEAMREHPDYPFGTLDFHGPLTDEVKAHMDIVLVSQERGK